MQHAKDQGGKLGMTYEREGPCPGFVVEFPADAVSTMEKAPHVKAVEPNQIARTQ
ncbi:hypothetical protein NA56DRAFT_709939 [Hyaloscypha hepaticicola]|uniref:Inhibitor I9 domain-containing protein n=1 Tax=Hyaloscypha hepaticicola TaxID=2082293 RepID=A0A2J6PN95_9HELO|nr:hypothetical protein NA56DRAFT_709939 [Hyaloscypha hepaticicola]